MTNENKNINELVSDDDDPTAELEAITFRQDNSSRERLLREADEHTSDFAEKDDDAKTISKLQYDIEQLRAKWLGLETEIEAREQLTNKLTSELDDIRTTVARKDKLIKARDRNIKSLKAEIRDRDEQHRNTITDLRGELETTRKTAREMPERPIADPANIGVTEDLGRLARTEAYADTLRRKFQDLLASHEELENERDGLLHTLQITRDKNRQLTGDLSESSEERDRLETELAAINEKHAEDLRILRFELGEAQETVAQSEVINSQLASDLIDTRGFKEELERMLTDHDEDAQSQIDKLEKELAKSQRQVQDLDEKLEARSDAINVLLAELARKSEQVESIGEIGNVISDIDDRISGQFDDPDDSQLAHKPSERITRMLVGKVGDKLLRFPLFKDRLTIGRTDDNDIQLNATYISRRHAVVQTDGETTRVIDWGSKNGVYVNSKQVTEHFLKKGDIVTIGNAHFRYEERPKREN